MVVESVRRLIFLVDTQPRRAHELRSRSIVGYTLLNSCLFCFAFSSKISPATAGGIDCNSSLFNLPKDDKKAADNFFYHRLKTQILSFNFPYIMYLRFCIYGQKNPCDFDCLFRLFLRADFNPDYLIFSRFQLKNRTTIKPTSKPFIFHDFNARRGISTLNSNSMVSDGNYPVRVHKGEQRNRATSSRPTTPYLRRNDLTLYQTYYSITYEHLFVKYFWQFFKNMLVGLQYI